MIERVKGESIDCRQHNVGRRQFIQLTTGISALAMLAACAPSETPTPGSDLAEADSSRREDEYTGGTLVWVGHQEVTGLSPNDAGPTVHWAMISNIHNALMQLNTGNVLELVLAESFEVADDGKTYTFTLRQGVAFHDDTEFTANDVKYTFDFYRNAENGSVIASNFEGIAEIMTPDQYTVVVNMNEPNAAFLAKAATTWIVNSNYHKEVGEEAYRTAPIGTGAFKLIEWVPADYTLLEAFEEHFRGRPRVDFLRHNVVPDPAVRAIALETNEADSATWPLLVEDSLRLREEGYTVYATLANSLKHFPLNNDLPQLSDKRVRQAMLMALDRQRIIDELWNGAATIAHSNLTPAAEFYYNANVKRYDYDPEKAKALLEDAGWVDTDGDGVREKNDLKLSFTCTTITGDQARRAIAVLSQQFLKEVGVDMQLSEAPVASILEAMRNGTMDASLVNGTYGSAIDPDASDMLHSDAANNFSHFRNARLDELLELGLREPNPDKRREYYNEIQDIVAEEVPFLYLQFDELLNVHHPRVMGLPDTSTTVRGDLLYSFGHIMGVTQK